MTNFLSAYSKQAKNCSNSICYGFNLHPLKGNLEEFKELDWFKGTSLKNQDDTLSQE